MKILLFGATGSAGGSVLRACLASPSVEEVRAVSRRPLKVQHPKLRVFLHQDFLNYGAIADAFTGVDACLFCLGVSSTQVSAEEYAKISHDFPLAAARSLKERSPGAAFHYITGQGTNEHGRMRWARVKGATERELIEQFGGVCWRPAAIEGEPSDTAPRVYMLLRPAFRLLKPFRGLYVHGLDLGRAMLQATQDHLRGKILENAEIRSIAERATV